MKIILKHILRNIWEKKGRSLLIILALTIATAVFVLNITLPGEIVLKVQETLRSVYGSGDIAISSDEKFIINDVDFGDEKIKYTKLLSLECLMGDEPALIQTVDMDVAKEMKLLGSDMPDLKENELTVSKSQAKRYGYKEGDKITLTYEEKEYDFTIIAIVENKGINAMDMECPLFVGRIEDVESIKGIGENETSGLLIDVLDDENIKVYAEYLGENNKDYIIQVLTDADAIKEETTFISYIMLMIFVMATIMIIFVVSSLNKIIIMERMPVIGTFRSIGATKDCMNFILILENAVYGLIGGIIGNFVGYGINSIVAGLFITTSGVALSNETMKINPGIFAIGVLFSVLLQVIISVKAIVKANKKGVKDLIFDLQSSRYRVLKHRVIIGFVMILIAIVANIFFKDLNIVITILSIVFLVTGSAMLVPYILQLISKGFGVLFRKIGWQTAFVASKNIGYNKMIVSSTRVVVVAVSLMLAIITVSGSVTNLFQSFRFTVKDYDLIIQNVTKEESEYKKLLELDGVTDIEYLHCYWDETTYNNGKKFNMEPSIVGMKEPRIYIKELNYKVSDLKADEVLIDEVYANKNKLEIGDTIILKFAMLNKELEYKIVGTVNSTYFSSSRNVIIMNYDHYIENINKIPMQVQLKVEDGTNMMELKESVNDTLKERNLYIQTVEEYITEQEESVGSIISLFYVVLGLAVALSFIGIINNQVIGFIQRRKEIAILNSTCMSKGQIKKMLFFETVLANFIAGIIAIIIGLLLANMIENFLKGLSMYVAVSFDFVTAVVFVGVILVALLLTLLSPMRKLKKMNIVNEIKYE